MKKTQMGEGETEVDKDVYGLTACVMKTCASHHTAGTMSGFAHICILGTQHSASHRGDAPKYLLNETENKEI